MTEARRWAFRIGYLADGFLGYARQPKGATVEGLLRTQLRRRGIFEDDEAAGFQTASRTDRGVHALGNVIAFDTTLAGEKVARALNALDPRVFCFGFAEVPRDFQPRDARERWYRYLLPGGGHDLAKWRSHAKLFVGEHDFASFSRPDTAQRSTRRRVISLTVTPHGDLWHLDLRGTAFLWGQVRKTVAALEMLEEGRLTPTLVGQALAGRVRLTLPLAPPQRLILMEVAYSFPFAPLPSGLPGQRKALEEMRREVRIRDAFLAETQERLFPGLPGR